MKVFHFHEPDGQVVGMVCDGGQDYRSGVLDVMVDIHVLHEVFLESEVTHQLEKLTRKRSYTDISSFHKTHL